MSGHKHCRHNVVMTGDDDDDNDDKDVVIYLCLSSTLYGIGGLHSDRK